MCLNFEKVRGSSGQEVVGKKNGPPWYMTLSFRHPTRAYFPKDFRLLRAEIAGL
jgi:hypothetical protein